MATIGAFALAALVWSYFGRLDVHATALGKIETVGYAKVIEPLDPGKVCCDPCRERPNRQGRGTCSWSSIRRRPTPTR